MIRGSLSINCRGAMESRYTERNRTITETVCDVRYAFVGTVLAIAVSVPGCAALPPAAPAAVPPASAQAGATTIVAVAAPAQAHMTLPEFLGLKGLAQGVGGITRRVRNRLGSRFPRFGSQASDSLDHRSSQHERRCQSRRQGGGRGKSGGGPGTPKGESNPLFGQPRMRQVLPRHGRCLAGGIGRLQPNHSPGDRQRLAQIGGRRLPVLSPE
jgi:hypothetical protein